MWWYVVKESDDGITVVYAYGCETETVSGKIGYNRLTEEFQYKKPADGDTEKGMRWLAGHLWRIITKENAPDERMIAIG